MPIAGTADLRLTATGNGAADIRLLNNQQATIARLKKEIVGKEKGIAFNRKKLPAAQANLAMANAIRVSQNTQLAIKQAKVRQASNSLIQIQKNIASLGKQLQGDKDKLKKAEATFKRSLEMHPELVAIKDDLQLLSKYSNLRNLGPYQLKLCLEISQTRKLPNGGWINVPIWHASPVQPILDELPEFSF
jgi:hypothetical protein